MALATFSVRMDENLKRQFDALCLEFGMNPTTAINVFARAVVRERKIPFEIKGGNLEQVKVSGLQALMSLREQARDNHLGSFSLNDINEEISKVRNGENV